MTILLKWSFQISKAHLLLNIYLLMIAPLVTLWIYKNYKFQSNYKILTLVHLKYQKW
jgi:hypothetical protein